MPREVMVSLSSVNCPGQKPCSTRSTWTCFEEDVGPELFSFAMSEQSYCIWCCLCHENKAVFLTLKSCVVLIIAPKDERHQMHQLWNTLPCLLFSSLYSRSINRNWTNIGKIKWLANIIMLGRRVRPGQHRMWKDLWRTGKSYSNIFIGNKV